MSTLMSRAGHLLAWLFATGATPVDPDRMALRDWSDLPAYHPQRDRASC